MITNSFYLLQRCLDREKADIGRKGVDRILSFDYMGSSEFEWGTLPHTVRLLRGLAKDNLLKIVKTPNFRLFNNEPLWVICPTSWDVFELEELVKKLATNTLLYKEPHYLYAWVKPPSNNNWSQFAKDDMVRQRKTVTTWLACVEKTDSDFNLRQPAFLCVKEGTARKLFEELNA